MSIASLWGGLVAAWQPIPAFARSSCETGDRTMDTSILITTFLSVFAASGLLSAYWYAK
jgi:hypothetical protein